MQSSISSGEGFEDLEPASLITDTSARHVVVQEGTTTCSGIDSEKSQSWPQVPQHTILVSSTSSDSHTWNLVFLQLLIEEYGYKVINLGPCVPLDLLLRACKLYQPEMLVISSVNGHGHIEGRQLIQALRQEPTLSHMTVIIGGKLGTRGPDNTIYTAALLEAGFDAVFDGDAGTASFAGLLETSQPRQLMLTRSNPL